MSAILLGGHLKSALAGARSLGMKGVKVSVGAERRTSLALHSKYVHKAFVYPSPYRDGEKFVARVLQVAKELGDRPVIYAFSEATFLPIYEAREQFEKDATLVFPSAHSVDIAFDKSATYALAERCGVPTIPTYVWRDEEVQERARTLAYPVVVKPRRSVAWREGASLHRSASFAGSAEELKNMHRELTKEYGEEPLIQTLIMGDEYGVEMLAQSGRPYALVCHKRLRSLHPTGGAAVLKETVTEGALYDTLRAHAEKLVMELTWEGPIMVEFKTDLEGRVYLMELNGRFWGSLPLSIRAGVDMPYLLYVHDTEGTMPQSVVTGRYAITTHFLGEVLHLTRTLFARDSMRELLYPRRVDAIKDFLSPKRGVQDDVWSYDDPKPAFMEIIDAIYKYVKI